LKVSQANTIHLRA